MNPVFKSTDIGMKETLDCWKSVSYTHLRQEYGRYNVSKIVNINSTSTKEEQLKDLITSIQQVKDSLVNILDEYEEDGEADKADTLTEALDALEDVYKRQACMRSVFPMNGQEKQFLTGFYTEQNGQLILERLFRRNRSNRFSQKLSLIHI